ncbi:glycosyltransferase family 59 protein [Macroventuria anomochaeta]|uniref:Glycosyltransferase family 59 protein n=1 Tax=Macroventuria anomochaeta TaxID=301207 RepID=A0ACB6RTM7_9PLEO|nr:glycosyltransferase family 59 protein [Macroventuria anomochaeta]KAF2625355.1 glycosyltransferase family 59 protein [Macroventuria anomochaeta]
MFEHWQEHVTAALFAAGITTWVGLVDRDVPEPYLDEYFHVPQAQKYCHGDYTWDPKITTPPGLYLVAKLFSPILGCSTRALRLHNAFALSYIFYKALQIRRLIQPRGYAQRKEGDFIDKVDENTPKEQSGVIADGQTPFSTALTAFNIASFPPLFFFGALYYTDVMSTATVLISYEAFLKTTAKPQRNISDDLLAVLSGVVALFFRQTNIFWVAVFPAGLTIIRVLRENGRISNSAARQGFLAILQESWSKGTIYDRSLRDGGLLVSDAVMLLLTTAVAALSRPIRVMRSVVSYLVLLVLFAGFVIWNGSVVLVGDKSAHTATIHTPQMLYIWPYIALFSAPILMAPLFCSVACLLPSRIGAKIGVKQKPFYSIHSQPLQATLFIAAGLLAVHFNTIIHPYTLADNRHYVFYVFRLLLRHPALKYLAVPVYYICFWLSIQSLAHPTADPEGTKRTVQARPYQETLRNTKSPVQISFVVIWLIATSLSVVTAPLVEPRYFIIPWIIWRLHVPHAATTFTIRGRTYSPDLRVVLETIWLLVINQVLQHLFLYRTFTWPSEPSNVQRFLW